MYLLHLLMLHTAQCHHITQQPPLLLTLSARSKLLVSGE
jgi:hypothetical protein